VFHSSCLPLVKTQHYVCGLTLEISGRRRRSAGLTGQTRPLPNKTANRSRSFFRGAQRGIHLQVIRATVRRMIYLLTRHPGPAVTARSFPLLKNIERGPDSDNVCGPRAKDAQTGVQFGCVSQNEIQNNVERRLDDTRQRRAQVLTVDAVCLSPLVVAPHIAPIRHGDECVQRYVKCWHGRGRLQRLGDARLARAGRAVQDDRRRWHSV